MIYFHLAVFMLGAWAAFEGTDAHTPWEMLAGGAAMLHSGWYIAS